MTRVHHFTRGLSASWFATLVTVLYGLLSVPLALRFLTVEEFGLFMLLLQLAGYFTLIELGMAGATARLLIDHKDQPEKGCYGSLILTGSTVFGLQGVVILFLGLLCAPWIVSVAGVPHELQSPAVYLLRWLCGCFAFTTALKMLGSILYAHKRLDLLSYLAAANLMLGLGCMALVLAHGKGLTGLAFVFVVQAIVSVTCQTIACWRLGLLPVRGAWGRATWSRFREMFLYAKDIFLVNISNQLLEASQLVIVTRTMGLTAAAMWSVGTKIFTLIYQLLTKIEGTAIVFFSEMMVRGEHDRLQSRFRQIYQISAGLAVVSLAVAVAINKPFVSLWAKPSLTWALPLSAAMGVVVFLNIVTRCNVDLILHSKRILGLRYLYFLEALAFVGLALLLAPVIGFYGVIFAALCCLILIRFWYTSWRVSEHFRIPFRMVVASWLQRSLLATLILVPFVLSSGWVSGHFASASAQLVAAGLWTGIPAALVLATVALPADSSGEIRRILAAQAASFIARIRAAF